MEKRGIENPRKISDNSKDSGGCIKKEWKAVLLLLVVSFLL